MAEKDCGKLMRRFYEAETMCVMCINMGLKSVDCMEACDVYYTLSEIVERECYE